jgi:WD40 repeat protein
MGCAASTPAEPDSWDASSPPPYVCTATLRGHTDAVTCVAWAHTDSSVVASASEDGTLRVWNVANNECVAVLRGHAGRVNACSWRPGTAEPVLASCSDDATARLWDVASTECLVNLHSTYQLLCLAWCPDGRILATGGVEDTIRLWDIASRTTVAQLVGHTRSVYTLAYSPTGHMLASGGADGRIKLWLVDKKSAPACRGTNGVENATKRGAAACIKGVAWHPDGEVVSSASTDGTVRLWHGVTCKALAVMRKHTEAALCVGWRGDDEASTSTLVSGSVDNTMRLVTWGGGGGHATLEGHDGDVTTVAWCPGEFEALLSGSRDATLKLWRRQGDSHPPVHPPEG